MKDKCDLIYTYCNKTQITIKAEIKYILIIIYYNVTGNRTLLWTVSLKQKSSLFGLIGYLKSQHARTLLDIPSFWKLQENHVIFWPAVAKVICSSGLPAGERVAFIWLCDVHVSATYTRNPPHQQSSCFLLVEKCRWLPLISPLVSDHLPGSAAALWRSTGISLWLNKTFHHNERTKLVHCVAVLAQNIIKNLSLYISSFLGVFFFFFS